MYLVNYNPVEEWCLCVCMCVYTHNEVFGAALATRTQIVILHPKIITGIHFGRYFRIMKKTLCKTSQWSPIFKGVVQSSREGALMYEQALPFAECWKILNPWKLLLHPYLLLSSQVAPSNMLSESQLLNRTVCHTFRSSSLHSFYFLHSFIWVYFILQI